MDGHDRSGSSLAVTVTDSQIFALLVLVLDKHNGWRPDESECLYSFNIIL
jgi:hypothetical protein